MQHQLLNSPNVFSKNREILNFKSKEYSKFKKNRIIRSFCPFFDQNGIGLKSCHFYRNILQLNLIEDKTKKISIVGIIPKKSIFLKEARLDAILEIWVISDKIFLKRMSIVLIKGEGSIWEFNFVRTIKKDKISIRVIFLFGTSIWIFDNPSFLPQFVRIKNPLFKIKLANLYQWKMCLGKNLVITGDISGKITTLDIKRNLKISQLEHNNQKRIPIGDLKLIEFGANSLILLISGGFDGNIKIWSVSEEIILLNEIRFNKRWLIGIDADLFNENYVLIFVSFENGFQSIISFNDKIRVIKNYSNQGFSRLIYFHQNYILSVGNDGYVNFFEINSLEEKNSKNLDLLFNPSFLLKWQIKVKKYYTNFQSIGIRYQIISINKQEKNTKRVVFLITGYNGIIISIGVKKNSF